jgi:hypothetical protein
MCVTKFFARVCLQQQALVRFLLHDVFQIISFCSPPKIFILREFPGSHFDLPPPLFIKDFLGIFHSLQPNAG